MTETLKAISMWQPWASLWLTKNKRHETRHWQTRHRGKILVHAAKRRVDDLDDELCGILVDEFGKNWLGALRFGAIVGMVDLLDVIPTEKLYDGRGVESIFSPLSDDEATDRACGNFGPRRFGWRRGTYWVFPKPIPYRGHQTIFNVPAEVVAEQIAAAREVCG